MDGNDVQLLVGASAPPPDIFAPMESGSVTQRIQEILESVKLPTNPAELEAMVDEAIMNQTMATEELNTLIAALESAGKQLVFPVEEPTPILAPPELSQNPAQQETAPTSQQEVQAVSKVQDVQDIQEDQGIQEAEVGEVPQAAQGQEVDGDPTISKDLAQALRQLPETNPQNGRISL